MMAEEWVVNGTGKAASRKIPVLSIAIGAGETVKSGWDAKNAFGRALDNRRTKQERIAASRTAAIYGRRTIFKAGSTVVAQIPVYGTIAALAVDAADSVLSIVEGDPKKIEKRVSRIAVTQKKSTEAFMQMMREKAEADQARIADCGLRNGNGVGQAGVMLGR